MTTGDCGVPNHINEIPRRFNFSGESCAIDCTQRLMERVDREIFGKTYWQSNALLLMNGK